MADSVIDLLFRIKKAGAGGKEGEKELNALGASAKRVKQEFKDFKVIGQAFNASMGIVNAGIKAVTDSAEHLGRTELKKAFAEASEAGQDLQDTLVTLKIGGRDAISWVTDAATGLKNLADVVNIAGIAWAQHNKVISNSEAAARAAALVYEDVKLTTEQLAQAQIDLKDPLDESARANRQYATDAEAAAAMSQIAAEKALAYKDASEKLTGPVSDLKFGMSELTKELLFNQAAQGLDADAAYALAKQMGLINEKSAEAKDKLDDLREKFDVNKDGVIDLKDGMVDGVTAMDGYRQAVVDLNQELDGSLQRLRDIQAEFDSLPGSHQGRVGGAIDDSTDANHATGTNGVRVVPPGYPNDSYRVGLTSGEKYQVIPAGQTNNWGGITVIVQGANVTQVLENLGRKADVRTRT